MSLRVQLLLEIGPSHVDQGEVPGQSIDCWLELGPSWIRYREGQGREVALDFATRRRIEIDVDAGQVDDTALLATLGLRAIELPNRAHIASVIAAGGAAAPGFGPVFTEHQLAVLDPDRRTTMTPAEAGAAAGAGAAFDIEVAARDAEVTYSHAGELLVAHSTGGTAAAPEHVRAFVQFVRYRFGGHPLVLERLAAQARIPEALRLRALVPTNLDDSAISLRVTGASESTEVPPPRQVAPAIFEEEPEPVDAILLAQYARGFRDDRPAPDVRLTGALAVARQGRVLEGLLAFLALSLEQPVAMPLALADAVKASRDPRLAPIVGARPGSADEARANADALGALRDEVDAHAEALFAMEAALRAALNEIEWAKALYIEALALNPWLVGAYKDLGDCYLREYEMTRAWRCWDAARRLAPTHPLLREVDGLEQGLVAKHPEYVRI